MANYSLVVNSKFQPFSFERYLQPYQIYGQTYREQEDALAELGLKANIWDKMVNEATDPEAYAMYKKYADDLKSYSDQLAQNGLTPTSRQAVLNMRARYAKEITPIERAYQLRAEDIKRQQEAYDKSNGRTLFSMDARSTPLSKYMSGTSPGYSSVNLDSIVSTGVAGGKALSSRYINTKEGRRFSGDYNSLINETGLTPEQAIEVLRDSGKYPEFERFINDTLANYGHDKYNASDQNTIKDALMEGINLGIAYNRTEQLHNNWRAQQALTHHYHELEADNAVTRAAKMAELKAIEDRDNRVKGLFGPTIPQGVTGKPDSDLDRVKGLKKIQGNNGEIGVTTDKLDEAASNLKKAKKALSDFENNLSSDKLNRLKRYSPTLGVTPSGSLSTPGTQTLSKNINKSLYEPEGYAKWKSLKDKVKQAEKDFNNEWSYLSDLSNKYSGYGDNMYDRINTGITAKQAHLGQQKLFYGLNANAASHTELKKALGRLNTAGVQLVNTKSGKPIKGSDLTGDSGILSNDNTAIGITVDNDKVFISLTDDNGDEYKITNIRHIDSFNNRMSYINKKLGDFHSQRTTGNIYNIPVNFKGDFSDALLLAIRAGKAEHPKGTDMYATTVRLTDRDGKPELVNIVTDGQQTYYQTMSDELYNNGKFREAIIKDVAANALVDLLPTLAHTPEAKEEEK